MRSKPDFGDSGDGGGARAAKIRALFISGSSIAEHTRKCFDAGVWTDAENAAAAMANHRQEVRAALREIIDGVPWAGEVAARLDGTPVWRQLDLWSYDEFAFHIVNVRLPNARGNVEVINRLIELCALRFGHAPVGRLTLIEEPV